LKAPSPRTGALATIENPAFCEDRLQLGFRDERRRRQAELSADVVGDPDRNSCEVVDESAQRTQRAELDCEALPMLWRLASSARPE
jgi:hypothetical protein